MLGQPLGTLGSADALNNGWAQSVQQQQQPYNHQNWPQLSATARIDTVDTSQILPSSIPLQNPRANQYSMNDIAYHTATMLRQQQQRKLQLQAQNAEFETKFSKLLHEEQTILKQFRPLFSLTVDLLDTYKKYADQITIITRPGVLAELSPSLPREYSTMGTTMKTPTIFYTSETRLATKTGNTSILVHDILGSSTFGQVVKCTNTQTEKKCMVSRLCKKQGGLLSPKPY